MFSKDLMTRVINGRNCQNHPYIEVKNYQSKPEQITPGDTPAKLIVTCFISWLL